MKKYCSWHEMEAMTNEQMEDLTSHNAGIDVRINLLFDVYIMLCEAFFHNIRFSGRSFS